ncbi:uncharacterized protein LOC134537885 isoform X4 [Bacillus rossius redtenbacheri]|uniref:uncharacterized protein LOC134537885 isoform X4 n=1 Tax=Bacillus rossius redtenbacheri TaxID=93214 RepID=UPI002FDCEF9D
MNEEMEQKPVVETEFVKVDSIKEEVEEETPLAGVQPAAVWQEEMEQKPVVEMEFVCVDSIKEEVEEETPLAGVQPAAVWQDVIIPTLDTIFLAKTCETNVTYYGGEESVLMNPEYLLEDYTLKETATSKCVMTSDVCIKIPTDSKGLHHNQHLNSMGTQDGDAVVMTGQKPVVALSSSPKHNIFEESLGQRTTQACDNEHKVVRTFKDNVIPQMS